MKVPRSFSKNDKYSFYVKHVMKYDHNHQWEYDERFRTCMICFKIEMCQEDASRLGRFQIAEA